MSTAALVSSAPVVGSAPPLPLSPAQTLKYYANELTTYEQAEILEYRSLKVFYLGTGGAHSVPRLPVSSKAAAVASSRTPTNNFGFDDAKGVYGRVVPGDHIAYRFEIVALIGEGSFGQVVSAWDHANNALVAVKLVRNKKRFAKQALVELQLLVTVRDEELRQRALYDNSIGVDAAAAAAAPRKAGDAPHSLDCHVIHVTVRRRCAGWGCMGCVCAGFHRRVPPYRAPIPPSLGRTTSCSATMSA